MDTPKPSSKRPRTPEEIAEEEALVDLIEEHRQEAITNDLTHKGLLGDGPQADDDLRHAMPFQPEDPSSTEEARDKRRKFL